MSDFITVTVKAGDVQRVVADIKARATDFSPVTGAIADEYAEQLRRNIDGLTGPELSEKYAKRKAIEHPGKGLGRATDTMYDHIKELGHDAMSASAGVDDVDYAVFEEARYSISNIPAPLIQFTLETCGRHLVGGVR